jgi:hypothetical protein
METAKATKGETKMQVGDKVLIDGKDKAEVVKVFKNGKVKVSFWVQSFGMVRPELWTETCRAERLSA